MTNAERVKFVKDCVARDKGIVAQLLAAYQQVRKDDAQGLAAALTAEDVAAAGFADLSVSDVQTWVAFVRGFDLILAAKDINTYDALAAQTRAVAQAVFADGRSLSSIFHRLDR
jgi:hypothetical protein